MRHDGARPGDVSLELSELRQPPAAPAVQGTLRAVRVLHRLLRHGGLTPRCLFLALLLLVACRPAAPLVAEPSTASCLPVGTWVDPATRRIVQPAAVLARAGAARVVLLGEHHHRADHHRWQLQVLAALQAARPDLVLGLEMFPRRTQPALDRWVAGGVPAPAFLVESDWTTAWGYPATFYLPLFEFARMNRVPMQALNVDRGLVTRVGAEGWAAIPPSEREGVTDPASPAPAYRVALDEAFRAHAGEADVARQVDRFVEAQLLWDRAMAEAIAGVLRERPHALVVGIMGSGHLWEGWGVPHQLDALGIRDVVVLLPWDAPCDCAELHPGLATAVFGIAPAADAEAAPLRLGVQLAAADDGVRVTHVVAGSVAAAAGLRAGDVIERAASVPVATPGALRAVVERQAPGTWLPLEVRRGREKRTRTVVARFGSVR